MAESFHEQPILNSPYKYPAWHWELDRDGQRAFGPQLLCEQVVGRSLRRQSYDLNAHQLFDVEYADVLGVPFDFTAKPVVVKPTPIRDVDLATGDLLWSINLPDELGSRPPPQGYATSPVVIDGTLIVQIGAERAAIAGFDPAKGAQLNRTGIFGDWIH